MAKQMSESVSKTAQSGTPKGPKKTGGKIRVIVVITIGSMGMFYILYFC